MEKELFSLYKEGSGAYSTPSRLRRAAVAAGLSVSLAEVEEAMRGWETYTRFLRKYNKPKLRDRIVVYGPLDLFQVDLAFLPKYNGFVGFIVAIDCFTRMTFTRTIKSKRGDIIAAKMREIFTEAGAPPQRLTSDYGKEFIGQEFKNLMSELRIRQFFTQSYQKSQFAERVIRSLKTLIRRAQHQKGSRDWPSLVGWAAETLNHRVHSATARRPVDVGPHNALEVFAHLYPYLANDQQPPTGLKPSFSMGQHVRILTPSQTFTKGFQARTSEEVYQIRRILFHPTIRYKLSNIGSEAIVAGSFTSSELVPVTLPQKK